MWSKRGQRKRKKEKRRNVNFGRQFFGVGVFFCPFFVYDSFSFALFTFSRLATHVFVMCRSKGTLGTFFKCFSGVSVGMWVCPCPCPSVSCVRLVCAYFKLSCSAFKVTRNPRVSFSVACRRVASFCRVLFFVCVCVLFFFFSRNARV